MIIRSPIPSVGIPLQDVAQFFINTAQQRYTNLEGERQQTIDYIKSRQQQPILVSVDPFQSLTFDEFKSVAYRLAVILYHELGLRTGDIVAVFTRPVSINLMPLHFAIMLIGGVYMPLDPVTKMPDELARLWNLAKPKFVFTSLMYMPVVEGICNVIKKAETQNENCSNKTLYNTSYKSAYMTGSEEANNTQILDNLPKTISIEEIMKLVSDKTTSTVYNGDLIEDVFEPFIISNSAAAMSITATIICTSGTTGK